MRFETFYRQLFQADREETRGDYLYIRLIELLVVYQTLFYLWSWAAYMPRLSEVILPLGIANYLDVSFMFHAPAAYLNAFLATLLVFAGLFGKWRYSYLVALLLFHLQYVARFSQGEISHGSNLTAMILLSFALANIFFGRGEDRRKVAFGLALFFAGLGYISAAFSKLIGTGPLWADGAHLWLWMGERSIDRLSQDGEFSFSLFQQILFDHRGMATFVLLFGLLVELCGFLLWFVKIRWVAAILLVSMHVGVWLTMNILFGPFIYLLILVGFPFNRLIDSLLQRKPHSEFNTLVDRVRKM